jgi:hypothetical protein
MNELIFIVEEAPEGGYTARVLGESIFTEADNLQGLHEQVRDAVRCHFDEVRVPKSFSDTSQRKLFNESITFKFITCDP